MTEDDLKDPSRLLEVIKRLSRRLADLESSRAPDYVDFARTVTNGYYTFEHGFSGVVRWWVVDWAGSTAPYFDFIPNDNPKQLTLLSSCDGDVIIRVERAHA
jgi:hypothetical protein